MFSVISYQLLVTLGVSPDEKIFTPTDERGFLPYTPHPTPYTLFQVRRNLDSQQFKMRETKPRG